LSQLTKRHIPTEYGSWRKEVDGIVVFLRDGDGLKPAHGERWFANMTKYYRKRLLDLLTHWPELDPCSGPPDK